MVHTCWRQDAVLVPISDPAMPSGSAYPSQVIMSRPQDREEGATVVGYSRSYMIGGLGGCMGADGVNLNGGK